MAYLKSVVQRLLKARQRTLEFRKRMDMLVGHSKSSTRAVANLWRDARPTATAWKIVVRATLGARVDAAAIRRALQTGIQAAFARGLLSPRATIPSQDAVLGRVIDEQDYIHRRFVAKSTTMPGSRAAQTALFRRLFAMTLDEQLDYLERSPLGGYKMWSTFDVRGRSPFHGIPLDPNQLRAAFGLDEAIDPAIDVLLTFAYTLPMGLVPRIPTVFDAYAAEPWPSYFLPSRPPKKHGTTEPWKGMGLRPRPEVVHATIYGNCIKERVNRVKA
jgi:hypothetical protein